MALVLRVRTADDIAMDEDFRWLQLTMEHVVDLISKYVRDVKSRILHNQRLLGIYTRTSTEVLHGRDFVHSYRMGLEKAFEQELSTLQRFFQQMTFLSLALAFMSGLILGGIISSVPAVFIILTLVLGYPVAIAYGSANGLSPLLSTAAAIVVNCFMSYAVLRVIRIVESNPRIAPYISRIRSKYGGTSQRLLAHTGRLGVAGALAIFAFLIGWWVSALAAYILNIELATAIRGIFVGALIGGLTSLAIYQGLRVAVPNPSIISLIFVTIFVISAYLTRRASRRKKTQSLNSD